MRIKRANVCFDSEGCTELFARLEEELRMREEFGQGMETVICVVTTISVAAGSHYCGLSVLTVLFDVGAVARLPVVWIYSIE